MLTDDMDASKAKATKKRMLRNTTIFEDAEVPVDQVVDVDAKKDLRGIDSYEDLADFRLHTGITKSSSQRPKGSKDTKPQRKKVGKSKRGDPAPTGDRVHMLKIRG